MNCAALSLMALLCMAAPCAAAPKIHWLPDNSAVEVRGLDLPAEAAAEVSQEEWARRFPVRSGSLEAPAMLGKWKREGDTLRFTPRFPFSPGITYSAKWQPPEGAGQVSQHLIPKPPAPGTVVRHVFPDGESVPENLLKFYLHFSGPMSRGDVYRHIHLRDAGGREVELPFLELGEELWNPDMTRLTLFIDPGRVKREVKPLEDIGPALVAGGTFTLVIDAAWKDAAGHPLKQSNEKKFRVTAPDRTPPDAQKWKIARPAAGSREALRIQFNEPMDHALALRLITVRGYSGQIELESHGTLWRFIPESAWTAGTHTIVVQPELEDLAGNSIGKPFEVDIAGTEKERPSSMPVELVFNVQ
jgi:hypothetical protein